MNKLAPVTAADRQIIERLGGPTKLAELLGYDKSKGGVQRIQNWKKRGIPPKVKVERPDLFMPELIDQSAGAHGRVTTDAGAVEGT